MSNLVIVAIPDENDRVWKVSSEKIPHLTLLFLGDVDNVDNTESIVGFVQHAAMTTLRRFYLTVDRRGELGADQADVLFFKKNRYDCKAVSEFRSALLKDNNIRTAYDSATQFEGPWQPHLTLGYPADPAKPQEEDYSFYSVDFNKIAVWFGDYEGPEFLLKEDWDDCYEEVTEYDPMTVRMSEISHVGVKGMRWGHRTLDRQFSSSEKKMAKAEKLEEQSVSPDTGSIKKNVLQSRAMANRHKSVELRNTVTHEVMRKTNNSAAKEINALKKRPEFQNINYRDDKGHPAFDLNKFKALEKEQGNIWMKHLNKTVEGQTKFEVKVSKSGKTWDLIPKEVQHAEQLILQVKPIFDDDGFLIDVELIPEDSMEQTADLGAEFLAHHGIKGQRWGVRKEDVGSAAKSVGSGVKAAGRGVAKAAVAAGKFAGDVQFENKVEDGRARNEVIDKAAAPFKKEDLPAIKARHSESGGAKLKTRVLKPTSPEAKAYRKDARETYVKRLESTANSIKNASGTREYTIRERGVDLPAQGGALPKSKYFWDVSSRNVQHADSDDFTRLELQFDDDGYIVDLKPVEIEDAMAQAIDLGADFLAHYGKKGMRWGHRKEMPEAVATVATVKIPHGTKRKTQIKVEGGENHPAHEDAIKVAEAKAKLKKSGTAALSNKELEEVQRRANLERNVIQLVGPQTTAARGAKFVRGLVGANKQLNDATNTALNTRRLYEKVR